MVWKSDRVRELATRDLRGCPRLTVAAGMNPGAQVAQGAAHHHFEHRPECDESHALLWKFHIPRRARWRPGDESPSVLCGSVAFLRRVVHAMCLASSGRREGHHLRQGRARPWSLSGNSPQVICPARCSEYCMQAGFLSVSMIKAIGHRRSI